MSNTKEASETTKLFNISFKVIEKVLVQVLKNKTYFYHIIHIFSQLWRFGRTLKMLLF